MALILWLVVVELLFPPSGSILKIKTDLKPSGIGQLRTSVDPRFIPRCPSGQTWGFSRIKLKAV
ncbi:MAG: hypothetical protein F6K65_11375 [Moorea sp. SIO3C2]|nr:hypothetical protein [Moorena sp. SIO3C2]